MDGRRDRLVRRAERCVGSRRCCERLIDAGLGSLPGGGAEIFDPEVRRQICPRKTDADTWLDVHRTAHRLGLRTNATMLYGHVETLEQRIDHLVRLRELAGRDGRVPGVHPAGVPPRRARGWPTCTGPSGLDDLRTVAVSRLMLDNFDHVKAYWISLGLGTAQTALAYGADDLDGTVRQEKIHHEAGSTAPQSLTVGELVQLIEETGHEAVERDTLYRRVRREGREWRVEE